MTDEVLKWIRQEKLIERGDTVLAGVSGGADSVCLLLVLRKLRQEIGFTLSAVHVEHGIRGEESRADEAFTGQLCAGLSVPLRTFRVDVPGSRRRQGQCAMIASRKRQRKRGSPPGG